ncbi:MAG: NAD(P)-dependent alcohol dehydrogenase [Chitinophagales bacterium]
MKAIICSAYGNANVLNLIEIEKPICKENEILIKVKNAAITTADAMMRKGEPKYSRMFLGCEKPKNPMVGTGFSGVVVEKGNAVNNFKIGDEVFGETGLKFGANAEYISISSEDVVLKKTKNISFEAAAILCDGVLTSYNFLKNISKIKPKDKVLIIGASGSLGVAAIQLSKIMKAEVTGVCSGKNLSLVQSLGADYVIDYQTESFINASKKYDIIYDTIGVSSFGNCKNILSVNGLYMSPVLNFSLLFRMLLNPLLGKKKAYFQATGLQKAESLKKMLNEIIPLVTNTNYNFVLNKPYKLGEINEAHKLIDSKRKIGNLVLELKD